jgi:hypothetical protein
LSSVRGRRSGAAVVAEAAFRAVDFLAGSGDRRHGGGERPIYDALRDRDAARRTGGAK